MLSDVRHCGQRAVYHFPSRIVVDKAVRHSPAKDHSRSLPDPAPGLRLCRPYWLEDCQHVGAVYPVDGHVANDGEGVALKHPQPALGMLPAPPTWYVHLVNGLGSFSERCYGGLTFFRDGIEPGSNGLAVVRASLSCLNQRNSGIPSQPDITSAAVDHHTLNPGLGTRGRDIEKEAIAITVTALITKRLDLRRRELRHAPSRVSSNPVHSHT